MKINYPTFDTASYPTPASTLYICDNCGTAKWSYAGIIKQCCNCIGRKGGFIRMRLATEAETADGKLALKTIIGKK